MRDNLDVLFLHFIAEPYELIVVIKVQLYCIDVFQMLFYSLEKLVVELPTVYGYVINEIIKRII